MTKNTKTQSNRAKQHLPWILLILGSLIISYPVGATLYNNYQQQQVIKNTKIKIREKNPREVKREVQKARDFNTQLRSGPILDPWLDDYVPDGKDYRRYQSILNFGGVMGHISIPQIKVSLPIYHGTTNDVLRKGVGHLFGTSLPVGGKNTHTVLTAHSGYSGATLFDNLTKLQVGDKFFLDVAQQGLTYRVSSIEVVLPNEKESLRVHEGKDEVTLVTCTPYAVNTHRLLVHAERIPNSPNRPPLEVNQLTDSWQAWMWLAILLPGGGIMLIYLVRKLPVKTRAKSNPHKSSASPK